MDLAQNFPCLCHSLHPLWLLWCMLLFDCIVKGCKKRMEWVPISAFLTVLWWYCCNAVVETRLNQWILLNTFLSVSFTSSIMIALMHVALWLHGKRVGRAALCGFAQRFDLVVYRTNVQAHPSEYFFPFLLGGQTCRRSLRSTYIVICCCGTNVQTHPTKNLVKFFWNGQRYRQILPSIIDFDCIRPTNVCTVQTHPLE